MSPKMLLHLARRTARNRDQWDEEYRKLLAGYRVPDCDCLTSTEVWSLVRSMWEWTISDCQSMEESTR